MRRPAIVLSVVSVLAACGGGNRRALVPGPETIGANPAPAQPYVVRMSDGVRDWEVEFPESATGYEVRIPLRGRGDPSGDGALEDMQAPMTEADRELLSEMRRDEASLEDEGAFRNGENLIGNDSGPRPEAGRPEGARAADPQAPAPSRPSYLLGINEVRRLYRTGNPEVAMVRLDRLLRAYPDDTRLLAMKGTLWLRLGRPELARRAYEEVLHRDPENRAVQQALRRLTSAGEINELDSDFPESASE